MVVVAETTSALHYFFFSQDVTSRRRRVGNTLGTIFLINNWIHISFAREQHKSPCANMVIIYIISLDISTFNHVFMFG